MAKVLTNGLWHAIDDNCYQWGKYKLYRSVMGWTVWHWADHSRRVGNTELMSQAMELAANDARQHEL